jgi:acyl-CoA thioesterase-1
VDVRGFAAATYSLSIERVPGSSGGGGGSGGAGGSGGGGAGGSGSGTAPFVIAVLGSSTAEGEGASSFANSWVGLLDAALSSSANVNIVNLAAGGYTTLELLPGSDAFGGIDAAIDEDPDLIVVALAGSNDLSMGTSTTTYLSRLTQVRDAARAAGIPTFFVSTAPKDLVDEERFLLADWGNQMNDRFDVCWTPGNTTYSPCFIDIFADLANDDQGIESQYNSGDGIHLNDAGHRVIFLQAQEIIEPYLCSVRQCQ